MNYSSLTLSQLTERIGHVLHTTFTESVWLQAEISELNVRGGHCYLELVEKDATGRSFAAKMRANCWASVYTRLHAYFLKETGNVLAVGQQVLVAVEVRFHPAFGLSLNIVDIEPSFTLGALARQRRLTIERLRAEGVMDMNRQVAIPTLPRRIAVISADSAAGYGDFHHQLMHNTRGFLFQPTLFPALMQGDKAAVSIIGALEQIYESQQNFDVVVLIRGGGASTDLACFDDYDLALHCAQFPLPIIAGIGHMRDTSVVDMVVHTSLKTPTAVAEWLLNRFQQQYDLLQQAAHSLAYLLQTHLQQHRQNIDQLRMRIHAQMLRRVMTEKNWLELASKTLELHSPQRILSQGYTLTISGGRVVRSASELTPGDHIITEFADGTITSVVEVP